MMLLDYFWGSVRQNDWLVFGLLLGAFLYNLAKLYKPERCT